jgi:hypothetical protein
MKASPINAWLQEHRVFLLLSSGGILSQLFFMFGRNTRSAQVAHQYLASSFTGRIDAAFLVV